MDHHCEINSSQPNSPTLPPHQQGLLNVLEEFSLVYLPSYRPVESNDPLFVGSCEGLLSLKAKIFRFFTVLSMSRQEHARVIFQRPLVERSRFFSFFFLNLPPFFFLTLLPSILDGFICFPLPLPLPLPSIPRSFYSLNHTFLVILWQIGGLLLFMGMLICFFLFCLIYLTLSSFIFCCMILILIIPLQNYYSELVKLLFVKQLLFLLRDCNKF